MSLGCALTLKNDLSTLREFKSYPNVVVCYGHFNIVHPGHIRYLQNAQSLGQHLVVVLQDESKADTKLFPASERAMALKALSAVDTVISLDEEDSFLALLRVVVPKFLVLGDDYRNTKDQDMLDAFKWSKTNGTHIVFHPGEPQYSKLESSFDVQSDRGILRQKQFFANIEKLGVFPEALLNNVKRHSKANILVIGDAIIDRYIACDALGMSAEAPVIVAKELRQSDHLGGASIVAAHCAALGANTRFLSVIGPDTEADALRKMLCEANVESWLDVEKERSTTLKKRYMVDDQKLLRVSRLSQTPISPATEERLIHQLNKWCSEADVVVVSDFVYGVITKNIIDHLIKLKKHHGFKIHGDLQCSSQTGDVTKFVGFDLITPTEREARIALNDAASGIESVANQIKEKTKVANLLFKLGADGFVSYLQRDDNRDIDRQHYPALATNVVDVAGAGDALLASVSTSVAMGLDYKMASAIGAVAASLSVQTVGNKPIKKEDLELSTAALVNLANSWSE